MDPTCHRFVINFDEYCIHTAHSALTATLHSPLFFSILAIAVLITFLLRPVDGMFRERPYAAQSRCSLGAVSVRCHMNIGKPRDYL